MGLLMTSLEHSTRQLTESSPLYRQAEVQGNIFHVADANCRLYVSAIVANSLSTPITGQTQGCCVLFLVMLTLILGYGGIIG